MEELLSTKQVQQILKVDRVTIYNMLKDGRLKGIKIGQQWRFPVSELQHYLSEGCCVEPVQDGEKQLDQFPAHCIQIIQDLVSELGHWSAIVVDKQGNPLTELSNPDAFMHWLQTSAQGKGLWDRCWKQLAEQAGTRRADSDLSFLNILHFGSAPIHSGAGTTAYVFIGPCMDATISTEELLRVATEIARETQGDRDELFNALDSMPSACPYEVDALNTWPRKLAYAVDAIVKERDALVNRLQRIAEIVQVEA